MDETLQFISDDDYMVIRQDCMAPAPLVINGGSYAACQKEKGHLDEHEIKVLWR